MKALSLIFLVLSWCATGFAASDFRAKYPYERSPEAFMRFHMALIQISIELDQELPAKELIPEGFDDNYIVRKRWQWLQNFILGEAHASVDPNVCFFGGWPSLRGRNGQCREPWTHADNPALSRFGSTYSNRHYCRTNNQYRCNPVLFGGGSDGRGHCVNSGSNSGLSNACLQRSGQHLNRLFRNYLDDPSFRNNHREVTQQLMLFCRNKPDYPACVEVYREAVGDTCTDCEQNYTDKLLEQREADRLANDVDKIAQHLSDGSGPVLTASEDEKKEDGKPDESQYSRGFFPPAQEVVMRDEVQQSDTFYDDYDTSYAAETSSLEPGQIPDDNRPAPASGGSVNKLLPAITLDSDKAREAGYYTYGQDKKRYATERTIWRLETAGKMLSQQDIIMAVGNISLDGGGKMEPHVSHQRGVDVDLRFVNSRGRGQQCTIHDNSCFDRQKTFEMVKALIDVDRTSVRLILINDASLRKMVNDYYGSEIAKPCGTTAHNDHIHMSWNP